MSKVAYEDFKGSRFTKEIKLFIEKLDKLYSCGINDCKPAFETASSVLAIAAILISIIVFFTKSGL